MSHAFRRGDFCSDVLPRTRDATRNDRRAALNSERVIRPRLVIIRPRANMPPRWRRPLLSVYLFDLSD